MDPTESNKKCPYTKATPIISGANDYTIKSGGEFYALAGVTAVDTCGNDITSNIEVFGNVVTTRKGKYKVTYSVTRSAKKNIKRNDYGNGAINRRSQFKIVPQKRK